MKVVGTALAPNFSLIWSISTIWFQVVITNSTGWCGSVTVSTYPTRGCTEAGTTSMVHQSFAVILVRGDSKFTAHSDHWYISNTSLQRTNVPWAEVNGPILGFCPLTIITLGKLKNSFQNVFQLNFLRKEISRKYLQYQRTTDGLL